MDWSYVLEVMSKTDKRSNQPIFCLINKWDLDDDHAFFDNTAGRPERAILLTKLQQGDRLAIRSIQDLADNSRELLDVLQVLSGKGVILWSCEEPYFSGSDYLTIWVKVQEINRFYKERARQEGYARAKQSGTVGRPTQSKKVEQAVKLYRSQAFSVAEIERQTGVSKSTLYRHIGGK